MDYVLSTHVFVRHRLNTVWMERIRTAGFSAAEIFCARQHIDYRDNAQITELGHWFRDSSLKLHSLHAPLYNDDVWGRSGPQSVVNICETTKAKRMHAVDEIKRAIEIADTIPFRYLIQHLGVTSEEYDDAKIEAAFSSLEELKVFAGQRGVEVLLENTPNALSSAERLNSFLVQTHLKLNYCFDIGHAHMGAGVEAEFEAMKDRIRSTHLHDNDGKNDLHLYPLKGSINWPRAMSLLGSRQSQYPLLLELKEPEGLDHPIDEAKKSLDQIVKLI